ncbi:FimV/HubP family polar landmark protein, partial [Candidatus Photodesmus blepharus]|uniref:FimV/HubP family polar landmark protein n=1 Tax=Candidatus Photodesmus blepharonis TaxID=1179155 RepID=UPI002415D998
EPEISEPEPEISEPEPESVLERKYEELPEAFDDLDLPEYSEEDALADIVAEIQERESGLLDGNQSKEDQLNMKTSINIDVSSEDWNGFSLSSEQRAQISPDIPNDEKIVWDDENKPEQAVVSQENWGEQNELVQFDPELYPYRTIDELMAEVDGKESNREKELDLLNFGLQELPDSITDVDFKDKSSDVNVEDKLNLAQIYIEMNDFHGAIKLLEEAIVDGSDEIRREAKSLIDSLRKKSR